MRALAFASEPRNYGHHLTHFAAGIFINDTRQINITISLHSLDNLCVCSVWPCQADIYYAVYCSAVILRTVYLLNVSFGATELFIKTIFLRELLKNDWTHLITIGAGGSTFTVLKRLYDTDSLHA